MRIRKVKKILMNNDSKSKRLISNSLLSILVKGGAVIVSLLTLPAYLKFFENEQVLGVWFTAISILSWVLTFDLGIGNGLRNHLVPHIINNNTKEIKKYISSAYKLLTVVVSVVMILGYYTFSFIEWNSLFNVSEEVISASLLLQVVRLIYIGITIQFILKLISSILLSMQKAALPSLMKLTSSVLLLSFLFTIDGGTVEQNLILLSFAHIITSNLPFLIVTIIVFLTKLKHSKPNIKYFRFDYSLRVVKLGGVSFGLQLMTMLIFATNEFLITWFISPEKVVDFQVYNRLFALISTMFLVALTPVWSAVTEASSLRDYNWISKLYKRLNMLVLVAVLLEIILIIFLPYITSIWLGENDISVNYYYSLSFAILGIAYIILAINSSIVSGLGKLKIQLIYLSTGALLNIPLTWFFTSILDSWIGVILANILSILPYCIVQPLVLSKYLKQMRTHND